MERLRFLRNIGLVAPSRGRGFTITDSSNSSAKARISDAHQFGRYAAHRRRAILAANVIDLEARLTDALLDMADKLIGGMFARARRRRRSGDMSQARGTWAG